MGPILDDAPDPVAPADNNARFWEQWTQQVPSLLRQALVGMPETHEDAQKPFPVQANALIVLGAALTTLSLTKLFPGRWKWLGGGLAVGSFGAACCAGHRPTIDLTRMKRRLGAFADALDQNPLVRNQFADYLSKTVTSDELQNQSLELTVVRKAIRFAEIIEHRHLIDRGL